MIRTKSKIYAEANDPNTVTSLAAIVNNKWLRGKQLKRISNYTPGPNAILVIDELGRVSRLVMTGQVNKFIGTDAEGNIVLLDRSEISD